MNFKSEKKEDRSRERKKWKGIVKEGEKRKREEVILALLKYAMPR